MGFAQMGHICTQCGWAYPKPHPSAKQRRAHKKLCGRVEGFRVGDLQSGEDGQSEDEPEVKKGVVNGGEVMERQISGKSEEDVYSDACNEFADLKGGNGGGANIHPSESPVQDSLSGALQVENNAQSEHHSSSSTTDQVITSDPKEAYDSPRDVPKDVHIDEVKTFEDMDSHPYTVKDVDVKGNKESNGIPSATDIVLSGSETHSDLPEATETGAQNAISENTHSGFLSSKLGESVNTPPLAVSVFEDGHQEEALCSRAEEVFTEQGSDISEAKDASEGLELPHRDGIEEIGKDDILPIQTRKDFLNQDGHYLREGAIVETKSESEPSSLKTDTTLETEPRESPQDMSFKSLPHRDAVKEIGKDETLPVQTRKDFPNQDGLYIQEAAIVERTCESEPSNLKMNTTLEMEPRDSENPVVHEAIDVVSRKDETRRAETTKDFPDRDGQCDRGGAMNQNSVHRNPDSETSSYLSDILQEMESSLSNGINSSTTKLIDASQLDNKAESAVLDSQNPHGEDHRESSKDLEIESVETSGACSQRFMDEDFLLDKQLKDLANGIQDDSENSFQQTDSVEGYWGSLSDATVSSSTSSTKQKVQEAVPNKDECLSKIDIPKPPSAIGVDSSKGSSQRRASDDKAIQDQHQLHISSLRAAIKESQERNTSREHITKALNPSPPRTRAPLKSFLADSNFDNKDGIGQISPKSPTYKDGAQSKARTPDNGSNSYVGDEWNSPAKLPKHMQRRKSMFLPFLCCSSVN